MIQPCKYTVCKYASHALPFSYACKFVMGHPITIICGTVVRIPYLNCLYLLVSCCILCLQYAQKRIIILISNNFLIYTLKDFKVFCYSLTMNYDYEKYGCTTIRTGSVL